MSGTEFTALLLFCTAMSFSPGPNTTLSTALAANHGLKRALRFCLAVPTGWTLLMVFFAFSSNFVHAVTGSLLRQWLSHGTRLCWFNRALALVLVATAAWMVTV